MPSRDPLTGKRLPGSRQREKNRTRTEEERRAQAARQGTGAPDPTWDRIPPLPIGDPVRAVAWWNDVLLVCADQVIRDREMPLEKKVRFLLDGAGKAGLIRDKAETQRLLQQILEQRKANEDPSGGVEPLQPGTWNKEDPGATGPGPAAPENRGAGEPEVH